MQPFTEESRELNNIRLGVHAQIQALHDIASKLSYTQPQSQAVKELENIQEKMTELSNRLFKLQYPGIKPLEEQEFSSDPCDACQKLMDPYDLSDYKVLFTREGGLHLCADCHQKIEGKVRKALGMNKREAQEWIRKEIA